MGKKVKSPPQKTTPSTRAKSKSTKRTKSTGGRGTQTPGTKMLYNGTLH